MASTYLKQSAQMIGSPQKSGTYFSVLTARGYLLIAVFALVFYSLCFLYAKHRIGTTIGGAVLGAYWLGSICLFSIQVHTEFPILYKFVLRRMRLYSGITWFFGFYGIFTVLVAPYLYLVMASYGENIESSLSTYSIKLLIGAYGSSIFYVFVLSAAVCNIVAVMRRTRCSKTPNQSAADEVHIG